MSVDEKRAAYGTARYAWASALLTAHCPTAEINTRHAEMVAALDALIAAVREECAEIADGYHGALAECDGCCEATAENIAAAIRARKGRA